MPRLVTLALLLGCAGCAHANAAAVDESKEPPLEYAVTVGEKSIELKEGDTGLIQGTFTDPQVRISAKETRIFPYQGVAFEYPRSFTFEADLSDRAARNWTLSGNDFKIMLFVLDESVTAREFAQEMMGQFGRDNCKVTNSNAQLTLGSHALSGTSLRVTIATHSISMDIYRLPQRNGKCRLLAFQDNLDDRGNPSEERGRTVKLVQKSFKLSE